MCANYQAPSPPRLLRFTGQPIAFEIPSEIYPLNSGPILLRDPDDDSALQAFRATFGLLPHWAEPKQGRNAYNARSETVAKKPTFRDAWRRRQFCLIPVDGFYEPRWEDGKATRWRIHRVDEAPFALIGLYETCRPTGDDQVDRIKARSFTMLTINATDHPLMQQFHRPEDEKRSVVAIEPDHYHDWLAAASDSQARRFLVPLDLATFTAEPAPKPPRVKVPAPSEG